MPASFRLVEPTALYARNGHAVQDSLTDVRHDGLINLIRQMASIQRHAADIFANVAEEILLIDERCGRLTERIVELDGTVMALPNPIKTKITCAGSISRYTNVKHHYRSSRDAQVVLKQATLPERPAHLMVAYRAAGNGRTGPPPIFETAATQTDSGRPTPVGGLPHAPSLLVSEYRMCGEGRSTRIIVRCASQHGCDATARTKGAARDVCAVGGPSPPTVGVIDSLLGRSSTPLGQGSHSPHDRPIQLTTIQSHPAVHTSCCFFPPDRTDPLIARAVVPFQTHHSDRQSQPASTPSPTRERSISPPICQVDIVAVDISGRSLKRAQDSRSKWPQTIVADRSPYNDNTRAKRQHSRVSSSTPIIQITEHERSEKKSSESPAPPPLSPTDADIYDWHAKDDFDYDYLPFQRKKTNTVFHGVYASLRRPKKRRSHPTERNSLHRSIDQLEESYKSVDADNSTDSPEDNKAKTVLRRSLSLRRIRRQKKPSSEIVYEELPFLLERDRLLHDKMPLNTDSVVSFKEHSRRKLSLPISTSSQVIHLATTLMSKERRTHPRIGEIETVPPEDSGHRPASVLSINSNTSLGLTSTRMAHDGFYRRGYQLDSPDAVVVIVGASSQSSPRDPLGESPDIRSTADSSYSCDQEGYYTSMHKDSGLTVAAQSGALPGRHSTLSAGDPTKPRGDSSGDSGAEDLQDACSDDKQRVEMQNTVVAEPTQQALPIISDPPPPSEESRPKIVRPKVIDTFDRNDTHRSTLPRQSRQQMPLRAESDVDGKELDEWLLRKFQTEMVVKSRARSTSAQRMPTPLHSAQSFQSTSDRRQQFAQAMSIRKAVRFCE